MLKRKISLLALLLPVAAAFGRLCVETGGSCEPFNFTVMQPPSGGCVLKQYVSERIAQGDYAAASARLCVEING